MSDKHEDRPDRQQDQDKANIPGDGQSGHDQAPKKEAPGEPSSGVEEKA